MPIDQTALKPDEMEPIAEWFRVTLRRARSFEEHQEPGQARTLIEGCARVFRQMRAHGAEHGYSPDLLFPDVRDAIEAAGCSA